MKGCQCTHILSGLDIEKQSGQLKIWMASRFSGQVALRASGILGLSKTPAWYTLFWKQYRSRSAGFWRSHQYKAEDNVSCSRTQPNASSEAWTHNLSIWSQALYHWALPFLVVIQLLCCLWVILVGLPCCLWFTELPMLFVVHTVYHAVCDLHYLLCCLWSTILTMLLWLTLFTMLYVCLSSYKNLVYIIYE